LGISFDGWRSGWWRAADAEVVGRLAVNAMKTFRIALILIMLWMVACSSRLPTPLSPIFTEAPSPVRAKAATPTLMASPAAPVALPTHPLSVSFAHCSSTAPKELIDLEHSDRQGWCRLLLPLKDYTTVGYSLTYPDDWKVRVTGAEAMNLIFNEGTKSGKNQEVFIQLTTTESPLEQADQATYGFEMSGPNPLVDPMEVVISKAVESIGDKQVLILVSAKDDQSFTRYFVIHRDETQKGDVSTLYMFRIITPKPEVNTAEHGELLDVIKEMITSMQFVR
jgi:hypothetical protein